MNTAALFSIPPQIVALAAAIREMAGDDDLAFVDTLDGETDTIKAAREAVRSIAAMEALSEAAAALSDRYRARSKDFSDRADRLRAALAHFMTEIAAPKLVLPEATIFMSNGARHLVGDPDVSLLPDQFVRTTRAPDRPAIKKALELGQELPGCSLSNAPPKLTIRTR